MSLSHKDLDAPSDIEVISFQPTSRQHIVLLFLLVYWVEWGIPFRGDILILDENWLQEDVARDEKRPLVEHEQLLTAFVRLTI